MAQNLKINILAQDKTKQAFNGIRGRLDKLKSAVFSVKGALVGVGSGLVIKSFVNTGRSIEDLNVRLKQLFGSTQEGAKAFDVMADFASKVPFSLEQIQQASGNLAVVAGDANRLSQILEITGNVASVTGLDFATTAEQIQRSFSAGIASADIFRERGVRDMLGFSAGATVSAEDTIKAFEKVFGSGGRFGKATDELANTFTGTLSMLGDSFFNFKKNVADAEFFNTLKKEFSDLDKFIKENQATFDDIADAIGFTLSGAVKLLSGSIKAIATSVDFVTTAYENLIKTVNKLPFVDIKIKTKEQRDVERQIGEIEKERFNRMKDILKAQEQINLQAKIEANIKEKAIKFTSISNRENFEIANSMKKQKSLSGEVLDKIKNQNKEFSLSNEIFDGIKSATSSFSRSLAEALVLGKSLNVSMRELAQSLLVEIIAKTIERIALKGIEKILDETLFKKEQDKLNTMKAQESSLKRQIALQAVLSALGGGFGGFFGGIFGGKKANGGAVQKGKPYVVGEQGAELFIPNSSGQITQSARGTGNGGAVNVNFNITTVDAKGFDELLVARRGTISRIINESVNERGREALI
jgi:hypothetical protein